jgi:hypothetical protein
VVPATALRFRTLTAKLAEQDRVRLNMELLPLAALDWQEKEYYYILRLSPSPGFARENPE